MIARRLEEAGPGSQRRSSDSASRTGWSGAGRPLAAAGLVRALRGPLAVLAAADGTVDASRAAHLAAVVRLRGGRRGRGSGASTPWRCAWRRRGFPATRTTFLAAVAAPSSGLAALAGRTRADLAAARGAADVHARLEDAILDLAPLPAAGGLDAAGRPLDADADRHRLHAVAARDRVIAPPAAVSRAPRRRTGLGADDDVRSVPWSRSSTRSSTRASPCPTGGSTP